jgi:hypothetical protein
VSDYSWLRKLSTSDLLRAMVRCDPKDLERERAVCAEIDRRFNEIDRNVREVP